jgi:diguanylate cyclase (GGDEF)-like protein
MLRYDDDAPGAAAISLATPPMPRPRSKGRVFVHYAPGGGDPPRAVQDFAARLGYEIIQDSDPASVLARVRRSYPAALVIDVSADPEEGLDLCRRVKAEAFTAVIPIIVCALQGGAERATAALEAGADEVLTPVVTERESDLRLALALRRAERDVSVHPTTLLPGTVQIERDFAERLKSGEKFAVCYADLDHFKEFNDRYGYHCGDRVILIVSRILRDVVFGRTRGGFVGHIGGDDFIFSVPLEEMKACCEVILETFDELIPLHYTLDDRELGHFVAKDRRGNEFSVPLMSLSIGVVTNEHRVLRHPAQISELATEMKTYAKTFLGSKYVVDRRSGSEAQNENIEVR